MKFNVLVFILLSLITSEKLHAQWTQTNGPEGGRVNCLTKVGNEIWMGSTGGIFVSSNDGLSWQKSDLFKNRIIGAIYSSGDTILVQYGHRGDVHFWTFYEYIAASFDQGLTWSQPFQTCFSHYDSIVTGGTFQNCQGKMVFEKRGQIIYTNDHGLSWMQINQPNPPQDYYYKVDYSNIVAVGYDRHHYVTQDFSQTWNDLGIFNNYTHFISDSLWLGLLKVDYPTYSQWYLFRSTNEGSQWDTVAQVPTNIMLNFIFLDGSTLYFESRNNVRLKSEDYGLSWQVIPSSPEVNPVFLYTANSEKLVRGKRGLLRSIPSQAQVIPANSGFYGTNIQQIHCTNSAVYCATDFGVFKSVNSGITWDIIFESPYQEFRTTSFISTGDTILFTELSIYQLVRSFDGGVSWDSVPLPIGIYVTGSYLAIKDNRLFISLNGYRYSDDWGTTWNPMASLPQITNPGPGNFFPAGFLYAKDSILYSISSSGYIFQYDESADIWTYVWNIQSENLLAVNLIYTLDSFLLASGDRDLAYSSDHGLTWTSPDSNGLPIVGGVQYYPREIKINQNVWVGINHFLGFYQSNDQGNNWNFQSNLDADFIPNCLTEMNGVLYCGSSNLGIWKYLGPFETISGKVYNDINNNGFEDTGEPGIEGVVVSTSLGNWYATSADSGFFTIFYTGDFDTLRIINPQPLATVNPPWRLITGASQNQDFGIYLEPGIADLSIDVTNTHFFRPGFDTYLTISVLNKGSVDQTPLIQFIKSDITDFVSANPTPLSIHGDTLTWQLGSMGFLDQNSIEVIVTTPVGTPIGNSVYCKATAFPVIGDTFPDDNVSDIYDVVRASCDPNDKTCVQGAYFTPASVAAGEALEFIVRFQNLGTLATDFVKITDTLSPYLDWSSFRFISASHPVHWSMHGQGIIEFDFDPLALPPASIDELGSMGFVKYSIRCKPEVQIGTAISNTAYIFFDFNPAVITNTTTTLIANIYTSIDEPNAAGKSTTISIYPNPATSFLIIDVSGEMKTPMSVVINDFSGRQVLKSPVEQAKTQLSLVELPDGFYIGCLLDQGGKTKGIFKLIVSKH